MKAQLVAPVAQLVERLRSARLVGSDETQIWLSVLFSAQATHPAQDWQVCLAHQLRDCQ